MAIKGLWLVAQAQFQLASVLRQSEIELVTITSHESVITQDEISSPNFVNGLVEDIWVEEGLMIDA
jgi:hypothetical protein